MNPAPHSHDKSHTGHRHTTVTSVLGWPAWLRVLAVLPVLVLLWLAVAWAAVAS